MRKIEDFLKELNACDDGIEFAKNKSIEEIVANCHRGDWLLWIAKKVEVDIRLLTLAKANCAKTVEHLMTDDRSKLALQAAFDFGNGLIDENELKNADAAAYAADAAAYAADAAAAAYAADAAAAAYAAYAAADAAAYAAAAAAAAYAYAKKKNQLDTANICRQIIGSQIIEKVNNILTEKTYRK